MARSGLRSAQRYSRSVPSSAPVTVTDGSIGLRRFVTTPVSIRSTRASLMSPECTPRSRLSTSLRSTASARAANAELDRRPVGDQGGDTRGDRLFHRGRRLELDAEQGAVVVDDQAQPLGRDKGVTIGEGTVRIDLGDDGTGRRDRRLQIVRDEPEGVPSLLIGRAQLDEDHVDRQPPGGDELWAATRCGREGRRAHRPW